MVDRRPRLLINRGFDFTPFDKDFAFALANSVFTHLPLNSIERCLVNVASILRPGGRFFATYFDAPKWPALDDLNYLDGVVTHSDRDPYHYHLSAFEYLTHRLPLLVERIGDWGHPRGQEMLVFTRRA